MTAPVPLDADTLAAIQARLDRLPWTSWATVDKNDLRALLAEVERLQGELALSEGEREDLDTGAGVLLGENVELEAERDALAATVARVQALRADLATEVEELRVDIPPEGAARVAHIYRTAGLSDAHDRLRAALEGGAEG